MDDSRSEVDPQGDTILVLRCPKTAQPVWEPENESAKRRRGNDIPMTKLFLDSQFDSGMDVDPSDDEDTHGPTPGTIAATVAESSLPNDSGEAHGENIKREDVKFRLSSRHLALASPVFRTMLNGSWKESASSSGWSGNGCPVRYELTAAEWDDEILLLLMNIIHGRNSLVPLSVDLTTLMKMSVVVDYYQCQEVTLFVVGLWIKELSGSLPKEYGRDCVAWMFVSWVFSCSELFEKMTSLAMEGSEGGLGKIHLPLPPTLLSTLTPHLSGLHAFSKLIDFAAVMEQRRRQFIDDIFTTLEAVSMQLRQGSLGCSFGCASMLLGSIIKGTDDHKLHRDCSPARARFIALSLRVRTKTPDNSRTCCTLHEVLTTSVQKMWQTLEGLKLQDYKGQERKPAN
ncbi:hypothetical protein E4U40_002064 [Claviceps sp. LM458 group G5]|nr:hypothetical protein E4U40_002064 [Claviceps sp. LM458 group G5]